MVVQSVAGALVWSRGHVTCNVHGNDEKCLEVSGEKLSGKDPSCETERECEVWTNMKPNRLETERG